MNGLNETIKTKKMPENDETEVVINTEGAVNAEAAATNRMFVRECVKERGRFSRVFETKGGEKAAVIYPKAVHFQKVCGSPSTILLHFQRISFSMRIHREE